MLLRRGCTQNGVQREGMVLRDVRYSDSAWCCAIYGTELVYAAMQCAVLCSRKLLRLRYALSRTGLACATTHSLRFAWY
eukprot:551024-Rhodomonas_salina.1